jgi:MFS family permease
MTLNLFLMTSGIFIIPMQEEFGWTRRALSIGPVALFVNCLVLPFAGAIIDRFGARRAAIGGLLMICAAYPLLAAAPANSWFLYSVAASLGLASPISSVAMLKGVATWFRKNSGLAFGLTSSGDSLVSALALPFLAHIVSDFGWRMGYLTLLGLVITLGLPMVIGWFRERPQVMMKGSTLEHESLEATQFHPDVSGHSGVSLRDALQDGRFWLLVIALSAAAVPIGGFLNQLQPLLASRGFTPTGAASVGTVFALAIGLSRIVAGKLLDYLNPPIVAAVCLALPALGAVLLAITAHSETSWFLAVAAAFLLGIGAGAELDFIAFFTMRLFGLRQFSVIYGTGGLASGGATAIGGFLFASIFDKIGNYNVAVYLGVVMFLCAAMVMLMIKVMPLEKVV